MEGETETSGQRALFLYYNQLIPDVLELPAGQPEMTFLFIASMSTVDSEAQTDFYAGKKMLLVTVAN